MSTPPSEEPPRSLRPGPRRPSGLVIIASALAIVAAVGIVGFAGALKPRQPVNPAPKATKNPGTGDHNGERVVVTIDGVPTKPKSPPPRLIEIVAKQANLLMPLIKVEGSLVSLPCPHQAYDFRSVIEDRRSRKQIEYTAEGVIGRVALPRQFRCAEPLPISLGRRAHLEVLSLAPAERGKPAPLTLEVYRGSEAFFEGMASLEKEFCPGHYVLRATFRDPGPPVKLSYTLAITSTLANGRKDGECQQGR